MPSTNLGGSITGAVVVTVIAVGARLIFRRSAKHSQQAGGTSSPKEPPKYLGYITPAASRLLVETQAIPHLLIQIHPPGQSPVLPTNLSPASLHLVPDNCLEVLRATPDTWAKHVEAAGVSFVPPRQAELVCLIAPNADLAHQAACELARNGFHRVNVTVAGHNQLKLASQQYTTPPASQGATQPGREAVQATAQHVGSSTACNVQYISRDGLAALLGYRQDPLHVHHVVLDVRRHDERVLYGVLRGSIHVPVEQLASALALPPEQFQVAYRAAKPAPGTPLVVHSRTGKRATWAAQVCCDAGLGPVLVYRQGSWGWRLDDSVKPYAHYRVGDVPPEPEVFQPEMPDEAAGVQELVNLGLLGTAALG